MRYGPNRDERLSGRDDVLAERIINIMGDVRRISAGSLDNLQFEMALARYPVSPDKIRKLAFSALTPLHTLVVGFYTKMMGAINPIINTSYRAEIADDAVAAFGLVYPWTLKNAAGEIQTGVIGEDTAGDITLGAYYNTNKGGVVDSVETPIAAANWTISGIIPHLTKINDTTMVLRHYNPNVEDDIFQYTLDAAGDLAVVVLTTIVPHDAAFADNPVMRDFSDGVNLWWAEADDSADSIAIHKMNLSTLVVTKQVITAIDVSAEKVFHAYGDTWFMVCTTTAGREYLFGTLADGATPASLAATTGTAYETAGTSPLLGTIGAAKNSGRELTLFSTPFSTEPNIAIHTSEVDMVAQTVTTAEILGKTEGWSVDAASEAQAAFSEHTQRIVQVATSALGTHMHLYTISPARQVSAIFPLPLVNVVPTEGAPNTFPALATYMPLVSVGDGPLVAVIQDAAAEFHLVEMSA